MRSAVERFGAMVICAAGIMACSSGEVTAPGARRAPTSPELSSSTDREKDRGAVQSVTGHAKIQLPYEGTPFQQYSVSAIRHRDGSFSGKFHETSEQDGGQRASGRIFCFSIVRDTARLAGLVERSTVPFGPAGTYVIWNVVDRGNGKVHDLTTDFYFGGTQAQATAHCAGNLLRGQPFFESRRGNIKVNA
jgi:hypothetical protein